MEKKEDMKNIIDYETPAINIKSFIDSGKFEYQGMSYVLAEDVRPGIRVLFIEKDDKRKEVMKIFPEENLYRTILNHIGYDISILEKRYGEKKTINIHQKDFQLRKKRLINIFKSDYGVELIDIVCFLKKSEYGIDEKDMDELQKVLKKLEEGYSPRQIFPVKNRSLKNFHWSTKIYKNFNASPKREVSEYIPVNDSVVHIPKVYIGLAIFACMILIYFLIMKMVF